MNRCPEMLFYVYYTHNVACDLLSVFGRSPGLMALHNSAQFCTIFFDRFFAISAQHWRGLTLDRCVHKNRSVCRAQVTGEQPTQRGFEAEPAGNKKCNTHKRRQALIPALPASDLMKFGLASCSGVQGL